MSNAIYIQASGFQTLDVIARVDGAEVARLSYINSEIPSELLRIPFDSDWIHGYPVDVTVTATTYRGETHEITKTFSGPSGD